VEGEKGEKGGDATEAVKKKSQAKQECGEKVRKGGVRRYKVTLGKKRRETPCGIAQTAAKRRKRREEDSGL